MPGMADLGDGETIEMKGSGVKPYRLTNSGGVYSCTCPAWRNQSLAIEKRTCKHLRKLRGDEAEMERTGGAVPQRKVGKEADGPPLLLAHNWDNDLAINDWWMSEKLDGVRAYWDGKRFLSRQGNEFMAPDWFTAGLPAQPLDGELWMDRKQFQKTVSIVRRMDRGKGWNGIRYVVFDAPEADGPFEERIACVNELLAPASEYVRALEQLRCRDAEHMRSELERIDSLGGEGVMLRKPGSLYEAGRSMSLLKVKKFHDAEALVLDHEAGRGRHKGRLGSLRVQLPDGTEFSVGTGLSDREREDPPAIGSTVTFRYQELSNAGVPRFPSFLRIHSSVPALANSVLPAPPPSPIDSSRRRFEFHGDSSSKFWEIARTGAEVTTSWGRLGTDGQTKTKRLASETAAQKEVEKQIRDKSGKGYQEV